MKFFSGRVRFAALVVLVLGLVLGGRIAYASIPDSNGVVHGCYQKNSGDLRVIDTNAGGGCASSENPLSWNQFSGYEIVSSGFDEAGGLRLRGLLKASHARPAKLSSAEVSPPDCSTRLATVTPRSSAPRSLAQEIHGKSFSRGRMGPPSMLEIGCAARCMRSARTPASNDRGVVVDGAGGLTGRPLYLPRSHRTRASERGHTRASA